MTPSPALLAARPHAPASTPVQRVEDAVPAVLVLELTEPLAGFPDHREFVLVPADASGLLSWLQALAPDGPRFLVAPAAGFFPEYAPVLPGPALGELGLASGQAGRVYALLTVPDGDVSGTTANLRAPLVVNPATRRARQVVLSDSTHPVRCPLRR
jgi:flagellar assembly factor FliW